MMRASRRILIACLLVVSTLLAVPATAQAKNDGRHNGPDTPQEGWNYGKAAHGCTLDRIYCINGLSGLVWHYRWLIHHGTGSHGA